MSNINGMEIERKFLIEYPNTIFLNSLKGVRKMEISQSYLSNGQRIRKIKENGKTYYIKTVKKHITDIKREEKEWEISQEEYQNSLKEKQPDTNTIEKVRYAVCVGAHIFEIDIFPFWNDRAFLEVELKEETEEFSVPNFIKIIKEVTFDKRYRNSALAKQVIKENII